MVTWFFAILATVAFSNNLTQATRITETLLCAICSITLFWQLIGWFLIFKTDIWYFTLNKHPDFSVFFLGFPTYFLSIIFLCPSSPNFSSFLPLHSDNIIPDYIPIRMFCSITLLVIHWTRFEATQMRQNSHKSVELVLCGQFTLQTFCIFYFHSIFYIIPHLYFNDLL